MTIEIRGSNILAGPGKPGLSLHPAAQGNRREHREKGVMVSPLKTLCAICRISAAPPVFRTIKLLLEAGIICKLSLINGEPRYSLAHAEHHHHTVCVTCGTIGEFHAGTVERVLRLIGNEVGGSIIGHRIELYISCAECARQNRPIPSVGHTHVS